MAGCIISTLAFTRASKWVVGGDGTSYFPSKLIWMTTLTANCSVYPSAPELNDIVKPCKFRSLSISTGQLVKESCYINSEVIPSIVESRWYNSTLSEGGQVEVNSLSFWPGKCKLWCSQFGLLPRIKMAFDNV